MPTPHSKIRHKLRINIIEGKANDFMAVNEEEYGQAKNNPGPL